MPPFAEQTRIVAKLDKLRANISRAREQIARVLSDNTSASAAARLLIKLDQAILSKALRGKLVPQNPDEELASIFLTRLKGPAKSGRDARVAMQFKGEVADIEPRPPAEPRGGRGRPKRAAI